MSTPSSGSMSGSERASSTSAALGCIRRHAASGPSTAASLRRCRYERMYSARSRFGIGG